MSCSSEQLDDAKVQQGIRKQNDGELKKVSNGSQEEHVPWRGEVSSVWKFFGNKKIWHSSKETYHIICCMFGPTTARIWIIILVTRQKTKFGGIRFLT